MRGINLPTAARKIIQSFLWGPNLETVQSLGEENQRMHTLEMTLHCIPGILGANSKSEKRTLIALHKSSGLHFDDRLEEALIGARFRNMKEEVRAYHDIVDGRLEKLEREADGLRYDVGWYRARLNETERKRSVEDLAASLTQSRLEAEIVQLKDKLEEARRPEDADKVSDP